MFKIVFYRSLFSQSAASLTAGYLAGYVREQGYKAKMELLEKGRMDNLTKILSCNKEYPVIIYKCNFQDYVEGCSLLSSVKEFCPNNKIFLMGYFAEINARKIMEKYTYIDGVIYGDGCNFAKRYADSNAKKLVGGLFRTKDAKIFEENTVEYLPLTVLPEPARDIEIQEQGDYINMIWRNGCYGTCKFCHINIVKRPFSAREIEDVVNEMEKYHRTMNKKMFIFNDSVFWWGEKDDKDLDTFVNLLSEKQMDINFMIYLRCFPFIGEERLKKLKKVGLSRVFIGIENVSEQFYSDYNKKVINYDEILQLLDNLKISYHIGFILFHPHVTIPELEENIEYLYKLNKLYRIGILIEKMRLLPVGTIDAKTTEHNDIDEAYDYEFDNKEVNIIYCALKKFFETVLDVRDFENVCTSSIFLMNLYGNKYGIWDIEEFNKFNNIISEYNNYAREFMINAINMASQYNADELYQRLYNEHGKEFSDYYYRLQAGRAIVYDYISQTDKDLHKLVFHGQRRLNAYD